MEAYLPLIKLLLVLLLIAVIAFLIRKGFDYLNTKGESEEDSLNGIYNKKPYFFSQSELAMYYLLKDFLLKEYNGRYAVFPKVGLQDFLYVHKFHERSKTHYNKIGQKHVDFLIVDQINHCDPVLAIELNGPSHNYMQERDNFVAKLYEAVNLRFFTFYNDDLNNKEFIVDKMKTLLGAKSL